MPPRSRLEEVRDGVVYRKCHVCGEWKPLEDFPWQNRDAGRRHTRCKPCAALATQRSRRKDIEARRAADRAYHHANKERRNALRREANRANGHSRKALVRRYGITPEQYDDMLASQGGVCAICGQPETIVKKGGVVASLAIDHCHETGKVRGLLCGRCNLGIGCLRHDAETALAAAEYLRATD